MTHAQGEDSRRKLVVTDIWNSSLTAELNVRYWDSLCRRYYLIDRYVKIFLAVTSSSTVAGWGFWKEMKILWQILYGISTITALALPILDLRGKIQLMARVGEKWAQILSQYDILILDLKNGMGLDKIAKQYRQIREKHPSGIGSALPSNKERLKEKLYKEIVKSKGLNEC